MKDTELISRLNRALGEADQAANNVSDEEIEARLEEVYRQAGVRRGE